MPDHMLALLGLALVASAVNGALGHGFSSVAVPLALLFVTNRVLNPALVPIQVALNAYMLWLNRAALAAVWPCVRPIVVGLAPGVAAGTAIVARVDPDWVKLATFVALLPLILVRSAGYGRPLRVDRSAGLVFGTGVGTLYAVTTISGPPLVIMLAKQGLSPREFRAALALVRLVESTLTALAYGSAGLYTIESVGLIGVVLPAVAVGAPLGAFVIGRIRPATFSRACLSFDAWVVALGISALLRRMDLMGGAGAYAVLAVVVAADAWLLYRFVVSSRRSALAPCKAEEMVA